VDTIKALADPTRLAILRALMADGRGASRVMSAKELAEELGEPQTKLYRHLKVLEAAGLIEAAETRLVSGIVETRYRAAQRSIMVEPDRLPAEAGDEMQVIVAEEFDRFRDRFLENGRRGGFPSRTGDPATPRVGGAFVSGFRVSAERAVEFERRFNALVAELRDEPNVDEGLTLEVLISWFARADEPAGPGDPAR
jgi:DNA-binding transcriptional ArsR family regulator